MSRKPFSQVLKEASISIPKEYSRLIELFYTKKYYNAARRTVSLLDLCAENFLAMPFRGTCISLEDFNKTHGRHFSTSTNSIYQMKPDDALDYLVDFCEYSYNLAVYTQTYCFPVPINCEIPQLNNAMQFYVQQVLAVIEKIGYMQNWKDGITEFAPKDQVAISVAEILDPALSYRVIEYNHHSMKGDLGKKKSVLLLLADKLEPQRGKLKEINSSLETSVFGLFNNINLRHNNIDPNGKDYKPGVVAMNPNELEQWYDETYQLSLLAFLELENVERKKRAIALIKLINS